MKNLKKIFCTAAVILTVFVLSSCELPKNDIKVVNSCGFEIMVNITKSKSEPSSYRRITPKASRTYSDLDNDDYYLHVYSQLESAPTAAKDKKYEVMDVHMSDTWTIKWESDSYSVYYHQ